MADAAKHKRTGDRGWLTRASKTLSGLCEQTPIGDITLTDAIEQFDILWNNLQTAQEELERFIDPNNIGDHFAVQWRSVWFTRQCLVKACVIFAEIILFQE